MQTLKRGDSRDGGLSGQCVSAQCADGLSAAFSRRTTGGTAAQTETVSAGRSLRRCLCGGCLFAGRRLPGLSLGESGCWCCGGPCGLRRGGAPTADAAALPGCLLRYGRSGTGGGTPGGGCAHDERYLLYGCLCPCSADCCYGGVSGAVGGVPRLCGPRNAGGAAASKGVHLGTGADADSPVGHRKRPARPGSRQRSAGAGCQQHSGDSAPQTTIPPGTGAAGPSS